MNIARLIQFVLEAKLYKLNEKGLIYLLREGDIKEKLTTTPQRHIPPLELALIHSLTHYSSCLVSSVNSEPLSIYQKNWYERWSKCHPIIVSISCSRHLHRVELLAHSEGLICVFLMPKGCAAPPLAPAVRGFCGVAVPDAPCSGVPIPNGLTAPEGGTGILISSGLPGTRASGKLGILIRLATLL